MLVSLPSGCAQAYFLADFLEDIRIIVPVIAEHLKNSYWYVRNVAIELLSRLAAQGMC